MSKYQSNIQRRIDLEVEYICKYDFTIRQIAKLVDLSKSTVHRDLTELLKTYSYTDYLKVREVFDEHISTRHLRGGEATRKKYKKLRNKRK